MTIIHDIRRLGQSIWLDNLSRTLIREGGLSRLMEQGVTGVTSNPSIFQKAVAESPYYRDELAAMLGSEPQPERRSRPWPSPTSSPPATCCGRSSRPAGATTAMSAWRWPRAWPTTRPALWPRPCA